ncbi:MAG: hypothetical protein KAR44_08095 [Candidatus Aegiribacteria sp.]|nr:hypothetical protein [Candidatus Aegiribacteria sp.]
MSISKLTYTALLTAAVTFLFFGCGESTDEATETVDDPGVSITVVSSSDVFGWIEMTLSQAPPRMAEAGEENTWLLFEGGTLLRFSRMDGKWNAYSLEDLSDVIDFDLNGETPSFITESEYLVFNHNSCDAVSEPLPEGFSPMELEINNDDIAVLSTGGDIAIREEDGFTVYTASEELNPQGDLQRIGPDWIFKLEGGGLALFDPSVALWQFEESPDGDILTSSDNILFIGVNDTIYVRTLPGEWNYHSDGHLFDGGLVLTENGISTVMSPGEIIAEAPSFEPTRLFAMSSFRQPVWAIDDLGIAVYAGLGTVETNLPYYETQRVSCSMAGQSATGMQGSTESVNDIIQAGSATFRIYESVSIRPDPFTEFSTEGRDARRTLDVISVEEFRLVGITLDPVGGDQAMVEDGIGVPYILYEGTILANNSHVAEITSNEVIVIQDVIVDYSARGGGETTIPTIYSLRLHEEGGL